MAPLLRQDIVDGQPRTVRIGNEDAAVVGRGRERSDRGLDCIAKRTDRAAGPGGRQARAIGRGQVDGRAVPIGHRAVPGGQKNERIAGIQGAERQVTGDILQGHVAVAGAGIQTGRRVDLEEVGGVDPDRVAGAGHVERNHSARNIRDVVVRTVRQTVHGGERHVAARRHDTAEIDRLRSHAQEARDRQGVERDGVRCCLAIDVHVADHRVREAEREHVPHVAEVDVESGDRREGRVDVELGIANGKNESAQRRGRIACKRDGIAAGHDDPHRIGAGRSNGDIVRLAGIGREAQQVGRCGVVDDRHHATIFELLKLRPVIIPLAPQAKLAC